jgi:uncharacterized protein YkwD
MPNLLTRHHRRALTGVLTTATVAAATLTGLVTAAPAQAAESVAGARSVFVASINADRHRAGRACLVQDAQATAIATAWAQRMAGTGVLQHNPRLVSQITSWTAVGENVGVGGTSATLHSAFMHSAPHRANILGAAYTSVGIGVAYGRGRMWVVEVFKRPAATAVRTRATAARATAARATALTRGAPVLRIGARGATVMRMQRKVGVTADGVFGPRTLAALRRWQQHHRLQVTGALDHPTRSRMLI